MPCSSRCVRLLASSFVIAALCPNVGLVHANPGLPLLHEQQRELQELERQQRLRRLSPSPIGTPAEATPSASASKHCWPISGVRLAGNTLIDSDVLNSSLEPLLQPCMSEAQINGVLKAITRLYMERGYLASRPYLANPLGGRGSLDILIVEGFVESVEFDDPQLPLSLSRAFPDLLGQPLTLQALEQGLRQMDRLRSVDLGADLKPGTLPGGTRVVIRARRPLALRGQAQVNVNNFGSVLVGRQQAALTLALDSPLHQNDFLQLGLMSSLPGSPGEFRGHTLAYSIPHGPWTLGISASEARYQSPLPFLRFIDGVGSGSAGMYTLKLDRSLWHSQNALLGASVQISHKRISNRISVIKLGVQSSTLSTLDADLNLSWRTDAQWNASLGYSQGLALFGADTQTINPSSPEPQFRKYRASLWHRRERTDPLTRWRWDSELAAQYSPDPLSALEQMGVGGPSAVRGFRDSTVSGSSGAVWRNTLSLPLNTGLPLEIRPAIGLDAGWSRFDHGSPSQRLLGMSAGLHLTRPDARLSLEYQRPLHNDNTPRHALEAGHWRAQLTLVF
ncbi:ShlB/FhaC/HecB family hemolysin secretion/activation protein [Pseudomonas putida CSV86]|uniref:ShlB/FhaC/HecB family hemolysin secretion/activation protein n=1 Tax=Pseudomonas bharatica CSV86 TaxID=1005395 RepID=A0A7K4EHZ0_9PSED|nr:MULTISPECIES: ShlB/FhaC/HecB family hemolysin secretion/activation protein [Pseudomonas]MDG9882146.1 POTRA domain-containing protein [Pseudomonas sp. GD04058]NNJ17254.1 ShlB/FhaC/HecB family hemolysin secretion/activation protein [Pseudomonas bharatica CSV86]